MRKIIIVLGLCILSPFVFESHAQIYNQPDLYYENLYAISPAAANTDNYFYASLNTNLSNTGFKGAPKTMAFYINGPVNKKTGVGLQMIRDSRGAFISNNILGSYSYKIKFGPTGKHSINLGVSAGIYWQNFDRGEIDAVAMEDKALNSSYYKKSHFINEIGALYSWNNLTVTLSAPNAVQLNNHYEAYAMYKYQVPNMRDLHIYPHVFYRHLPENISQLDAGIRFKYKSVWTSFGYRTDNSFLGALGVYYKKYRLAYSFNYNNSALSNIATGTHEIMFTYNFNLDFLERRGSYNRKKMPWE